MEIEIGQLDRKYAALRIDDPTRRAQLAASIARHGQQAPEEVALRAVDPAIGRLVDALRRRHGGRAVRSIQKLHRIYLDYPTEAVVAAVGTALAYDLVDLVRIERMVLRTLAGTWFRLPLDGAEDDDDR